MQQIVEATGKPKGKISKFLAIHDRVVPSAKKPAEAGGDGKARLSKRHLYNLSKLKPDEQTALARDAESRNLTALGIERAVQDAHHHGGRVSRAAVCPLDNIGLRQPRQICCSRSATASFRRSMFVRGLEEALVSLPAESKAHE